MNRARVAVARNTRNAVYMSVHERGMVPDRLEYVYEVVPPEIQDNVETLIRMLRDTLKDVR